MNFKKKCEKLPKEIRDFFVSDIPMKEIKKSFVIMGKQSSYSSSVAKEVGMIFVGDIQLEKLPKVVAENTGFDLPTAYGISYEINKRIFSRFPNYFTSSEDLLEEWGLQKRNPDVMEKDAMEKVLKEEPWLAELEKLIQDDKKEQAEAERRKVNLVKLTVQEALKKYPSIGEQLLTSNKIKTKSFPQPIQPSVKNWINDYQESMGVKKHGVIERGNYLFHGTNTKKLTSGERQKLAVILKSLDENFPVSIDADKKEFFFSNIKKEVPSNLPESPGGGKNNLRSTEIPRVDLRQKKLLQKEQGQKNNGEKVNKIQELNKKYSDIKSPESKSSDKKGVSFSFPHKFSGESKMPVRRRGFMAPVGSSDSYSVRASQKSEPRIDKNTVDLRE